MADKLFRLHPNDFAYLKGLYGADEFVRIDGHLFISMKDEKKLEPVKAIVIDHVDKGPIIIKRHGKLIYED